MKSSTASNDNRIAGRTLVIDSVSRACSVALIEDGSLLAADYREIGRGHAERLVPMIAALPGKGQAERIAVNCGPGSFTGVRIGLSVARALAFAWNADLVGYNSLSLVAAGAFAKSSDTDRIAVVMAGGHGEYLAALYARSGQELRSAMSLPPDRLSEFLDQDVIAGDTFETLPPCRAVCIDQLPDARAFPLLKSEALIPADAIYARAPDARMASQK